MRLLKTSVPKPDEYALRFREFYGSNIPPYAILSHMWSEGEEVLFQDVIQRQARGRGLEKVLAALSRARADGYSYVWVDTCCIDKSSSAELSEAINSMYAWYQDAAICYAYLSDVPSTDKPFADKSHFARSRWFSRGWTLQELLAPNEVQFLSMHWMSLGTKDSLADVISRRTQIRPRILRMRSGIQDCSISERMSWAAGRETTRTEDAAYCLMGLFSVNMPLLYGEGRKAFQRLQEEIMRYSDDQSLFAWINCDCTSDTEAPHGLLACSATAFGFNEASSTVPYRSKRGRTPYAMTNRGLQITLHMMPVDDSETTYQVALECGLKRLGDYAVIYLCRNDPDDDQFHRIKWHKLGAAQIQGATMSVFVPQARSSRQRRAAPLQLSFTLDHLSEPYELLGTQTLCDAATAQTLSACPDEYRLLAPRRPGMPSARLYIAYCPSTRQRPLLTITLGFDRSGRPAFDAELLKSTSLESAKRERPLEKFWRPRLDPEISGRTVLLQKHCLRVDFKRYEKSGVEFIGVSIIAAHSHAWFVHRYFTAAGVPILLRSDREGPVSIPAESSSEISEQDKASLREGLHRDTTEKPAWAEKM
ncbi:hypothetical protein KC340_g13145 [Hortaea werneckii]|nr:hypothetical protein KC342_g13485 [Hortaea werneckii]KAI7093739.1 hypothetical protein KC339_g11974 [Hortaea werneckii]KAI7224552.1 hypothetical protein KC365_g10618 [Hortaea werneckii]KAI7301078.1 hypothetical protein KC340_g13145 [Hortaea werneckii]KAI7373307.1 hypothetical protein KC328_g16698 [Hortaea werneckii]